MPKRAPWVVGLCGLISVSCSGGSSGGGGPTGAGGSGLAGTWDLTTTPTGSSPVVTTVTLGQDSLSITSPDFTLTAVRTGNALAFTDEASPGDPGSAAVLTATQTASTFAAGIVPFDLGGSWTMQGGPTGGSPTVTCTLDVAAAEIDGACQQLAPAGPWFSFTTTKVSTAASSFGDLGGTWTNTWVWPGTSGGTFTCTLGFTGNDVTTCAGGATSGQVNGSPLAGITFTFDGANTVSGAAQGWAEFSASRR
ncbi:MAG: hypothetical protein ACRELB_02295 [Polyangiaceae bacterium]